MKNENTINQTDMLRHNILQLVERLNEMENRAGVKPQISEIKERPKSVTIVKNVRERKSRGRAAVVAWDMGHNPVGRAMVIYDLLEADYEVELIGPIWSRYGNDVWPPIRNSDRNIRSFKCETFADFYPAALAFSESTKYDLVVACKARLPSMLLAAMIKRQSNCPMLVDVDDFELSFFKDDSRVELDEFILAGASELTEPFEQMATQTADGLVSEFDGVVVSNVALQDRFGGYIIRHARDELLFSSERISRRDSRKELGIRPNDFCLLFVGTVRPHKGIFKVADTLEEMNDDRFVLHVVGDITNRSITKRLLGYKKARIILHPGCSFDKLPTYIAAADVVPLLQDPDHPISQYQIPAKISDASAFGVPVLATSVPPLKDLEKNGVLRIIEPSNLASVLIEMINTREDEFGQVFGRLNEEQFSQLNEEPFGQVNNASRIAFESEFGIDVNRERLLKAVEYASKKETGNSDRMTKLLDHVHEQYMASQRVLSKGPNISNTKSGNRKPDLVAFWKQNDSGIFGRRSDMILKYLTAGGYRNKILLFDKPISTWDLARLAEDSRGPNSNAGQILRNTVNKCLGLSDETRFFSRTYIFGAGFNEKSLITQGSKPTGYLEWIEQQFSILKFDAKKSDALCFPVVFDFPQIAKSMKFRRIFCDIIDDQRAFPMRANYRKKVAQSYEETIPLADVVTTNCEPIINSFQSLSPHIKVIPNGTELMLESLKNSPTDLKTKKPVAGYIGNLRDRFDWNLIAQSAVLLPNVMFYIIGGGARPEDTVIVEGLPNVTLAGVIPYNETQAYMAAFDVALVPHTQTNLTNSMNPLKIYSYFAAEKPIVSTEVANIDKDLLPYIRFATNPEEFAAGIQAAIDNPLKIDKQYQKALKNISWSNRVKHFAKHVK